MESPLMNKYSIVLVPFPFDDFSTTKDRPALCLTNEIGTFQHIVIAFISSKIPMELTKFDVVIEKDSDLWQGSGLSVNSVIRLHKIVTIPKTLIKRKLGVINNSTQSTIKEKVILLFDN